MNELRRYVILSRKTLISASDLLDLGQMPGVRIVDSIGEKALLADFSLETKELLQKKYLHWLISEEVTHPSPGPMKPPNIEE